MQPRLWTVCCEERMAPIYGGQMQTEFDRLYGTCFAVTVGNAVATYRPTRLPVFCIGSKDVRRVAHNAYITSDFDMVR
jgi:hypothetical protein